MRYDVLLYTTAEGVTAGVPALPGCWTEGDTAAEALANARDAIREYLASLDGPPDDPGFCRLEVRDVDVTV